MQQPRNFSWDIKLLLGGWALVIFLFGMWLGRFGIPSSWERGLGLLSEDVATMGVVASGRRPKTASRRQATRAAPRPRQRPSAEPGLLARLPQLAFERLAYASRADAERLLRQMQPACGCGRSLGQCLLASPRCGRYRAAASLLLTRLQQGSAPADVAREVGRTLRASGPSPRRPTPQTLSSQPPPVIRVAAGAAPSLGPATAPLTLVAFLDLTDRASRGILLPFRRLQLRYGHQNVRIVLRHFPLSTNALSARAAEASMCAHAQSKLWPYVEKLLRHRGALAHNDLIGYAKELKFDLKRFEREFNTGRYRHVVTADLAAAARLRLPGAPYVFINGRPVKALRQLGDVAAVAWQHAQRLLAQGVAPTQLYDAATRKGRRHL